MFHGKVIDISDDKISIDKAQLFITSEKCGASLFFVGTVRNHNNNKNVTGITYDSHDPVVFIEHAKGYIALGGISIVIAVACKHRAQVFELSRYIIEEIKKRTPIWKKEHYDNEKSSWLKGNVIIDNKE